MHIEFRLFPDDQAKLDRLNFAISERLRTIAEASGMNDTPTVKQAQAATLDEVIKKFNEDHLSKELVRLRQILCAHAMPMVVICDGE